jgi:hypothetical protein
MEWKRGRIRLKFKQNGWATTEEVIQTATFLTPAPENQRFSNSAVFQKRAKYPNKPQV